MLDYVVTHRRGASETVPALQQLLASASRLFDITDTHAVHLHDCCFLVRRPVGHERTPGREAPLFVSLDGTVPAVLDDEASKHLVNACGTGAAVMADAESEND